MKKILSIFTIAMGLVLPMQAQFTPISADINVNQEQKVMRKAVANSDVTVEDLVGKYDAYAQSAFQGYPDETWTVTITADETDANKLWIQPIFLFGDLPTSKIAPVYATFDASKGTLSLPMGQCVYADTQYNMILGTSEDGVEIDTESTLVMNISNSSEGLVIELKALFGVGDSNANEWWYQALGYTTFTKQVEVPSVYIYGKDAESSPMRIKTSNLYFNTVDGEACVTVNKTISNDVITGEYEAYAQSAFQGYPDETWTMTITRDENDANKVWLHPIFLISGLGASDVAPVYATFDETSSMLTVPMGQCLFGGEGQQYNLVLATTDAEYQPVTTGEMNWKVVAEGNDRSILVETPIGTGNLTDNSWWFQCLALTSFEREAGLCVPLAEIGRITREAPQAPVTDSFFQSGDYTWNFQFSEDQEEWYDLESTSQFVYVSEFDMAQLSPDFEGLNATRWDVSGFMTDVFQFASEEDFTALTFPMEYDGTPVEMMMLFDVDEQNAPCLGELTFNTQDGGAIDIPIYFGNLDDDGSGQQVVYYNSTFVVMDGVCLFDGGNPVLFYEYGGGLYLLAVLDGLEIVPATSGAAARLKARSNVTFNLDLSNPIPLNKAEGLKKVK